MAGTKVPYLPQYGGLTSTPELNSPNALGGVLSGIFGPEFAQQLQLQASALTQGTGTGNKFSQTIQPSIYSKSQADAKIRDVFKFLFKRDPDKKELKRWRDELIAAQKRNPAKQTYKRVGNQIVQTAVGGLDETEWLYKKLTSDPEYQKELNKLAAVPQAIDQRVADKQAYQTLVKNVGQDAKAIAGLENTTSYGIAIRDLKNKIKMAADKAGATYNEVDLTNWANEAYDTNQDTDPYTFQRFLDSKFKFVGSEFKGEALNTFTALRDVAIANGLDINKVFGSQINDWIKAVDQGANIEEFKKKIRDVAKIGMPANVAALLDQGIDLNSIYAPYQSVMESVLELPRGTITLDDPTLRAAITSQGEIPLYEFEKQLRKDPRWQYTNNARETVSSSVLQVLRDFGFQG